MITRKDGKKHFRRSLLVAALYSVLGMAAFANASPGEVEIHQHKAREVGEYPVPKIQLSVFRDAMDGVNVQVTVENYLLNAPQSAANLESERLTGHAHVFVNGVKKQRLYGQDIHIPQAWLKPGVNQVAISLNSHAHENWTVDGNTIVGSVFIDLENPALVLHNFTSQPISETHTHRAH